MFSKQRCTKIITALFSHILDCAEHLPLDDGRPVHHDDGVYDAGEEVIVDGTQERFRSSINVDLNKESGANLNNSPLKLTLKA